MVALDHNPAPVSHGLRRPRFSLSGISLVGAIALTAAALILGAAGWRGFSDNGLRLGSELGWRFASFVYVAAIIAGPLGRLVPVIGRVCPERRKLIWGFAASFGVYLASIVVPNTIRHDGLTAGITLVAAFGGCVAVVICYAASRSATAALGEAAQRTLLGVGLAYFWLCYALMGLAHISGPHRPDSYFGIILALTILALLLRFADRFAAKVRGAKVPRDDQMSLGTAGR